MRALLIGYGEIGRGLYDVFSPYHNISIHDPNRGKKAAPEPFDILLIAFPYTEQFLEQVLEYQTRHAALTTIIFSTVPIGTCRKLGACHCPIEGKHPSLAESIRRTDRWLGGRSFTAENFLHDANFKVITLPDPEHTEFLKLRSTTLYGLNIEFARYSKKVCDTLSLPFERVKEWDQWVNDLYYAMDMPWAMRYILDPPEGPKGGHCVTPNARILQEQFPDPLVRVVGELLQ